MGKTPLYMNLIKFSLFNNIMKTDWKKESFSNALTIFQKYLSFVEMSIR